MIETLRKKYNDAFTKEQYQALLADIERDFPGLLEFRVAETPVFVPRAFGHQLREACDAIIDVIAAPDFHEKSSPAVPEALRVPNENPHTSFLAIDFAVCRDQSGQLVPQLIELQGFPSIFGFQSYVSELFRKHFPLIPDDFSNYFAATDQVSYIGKLRQTIVGDELPEHVILLELFPEKQKTRIDFAVTEQFLGIRTVCLTKIKKQGRTLYYDRDGVLTEIRCIYNRLIFDELAQYPDLESEFKLTDDVEVTWVGHPNWFFRISKYTLPYLSSPYIPESRFLHSYEGTYPADLENYVLKPLFSFAGSGVKLQVTADELRAIPDPEHYLLQRKVNYEPVIDAPGGVVKCEIRMLYTWPLGHERPTLLTNLARLSRGEMIGVRFNKDFDWVGGSTCFFER